MAQTLTFGESGFTITTDTAKPGTNRLEVGQSGATLQGSNSDNSTIVGLEVVGNSANNRLELSSQDLLVAVNRLEASLSSGDDVLTILGNTRLSSINMGADNDTFSTDSQFRDGSSLVMGTGDDTARFNGTGSRFADGTGNVLVDSSVSMGEGNDVLVFGGSTRGGSINLGAGSDTARFRASAASTSLNLGGDRDVDTVFLSASGNYDSLRITGADNSDVLFIGSSEYNYRASLDGWRNIADRNDVRFFNG